MTIYEKITNRIESMKAERARCRHKVSQDCLTNQITATEAVRNSLTIEEAEKEIE